jgi:hypothetical protein
MISCTRLAYSRDLQCTLQIPPILCIWGACLDSPPPPNLPTLPVQNSQLCGHILCIYPVLMEHSPRSAQYKHLESSSRHNIALLIRWLQLLVPSSWSEQVPPSLLSSWSTAQVVITTNDRNKKSSDHDVMIRPRLYKTDVVTDLKFWLSIKYMGGVVGCVVLFLFLRITLQHIYSRGVGILNNLAAFFSMRRGASYAHM